MIPLLVGVGRHFMLEPMMTALSTLSIAIAIEWKHRPSIWMACLTGSVSRTGCPHQTNGHLCRSVGDPEHLHEQF